MTNSEKYLKDGVSVDEFIKDMFSSQHPEEIDRVLYLNRGTIDYWLKSNIKPTLTEDEKVILRNIETDNFGIIGKTNFNELYLANYTETRDIFIKDIFIKDLFQFIKPRRRI